jgi:hypothetical protein
MAQSGNDLTLVLVKWVFLTCAILCHHNSCKLYCTTKNTLNFVFGFLKFDLPI